MTKITVTIDTTTHAIVPREITEEMEIAYYDAHDATGEFFAGADPVWDSMLAAAPPHPSAWQPIEDAPKMMTLILWAATEWENNGKVTNWKMATGHFSTGHNAWIWDGIVLDKPYHVLPTHWMPMPKPPKEKAE